MLNAQCSRGCALAGTIAIVIAALTWSASKAVVIAATACAAPDTSSPMLVTAECIDPEWDLLGVGDYPVAGQLATPAASVSVKTTYSYSKPGTYFPVIRVTSRRDGDAKSPYARVQNLGRVRVVVK